MSLKNKKIIVGVSGSIAAYKSALLVRLLVKAGAEVQVIMTASAQDFIRPLTLATLSKRPVFSDFVKDNTGQWNNHVELGLWADIIIIAPATAHTLAKCANGLSNDLLTAVYLSAKCPVFFAPAMDLDMYQHPSTLANINKLKQFNNKLINAEFGELASGLVGDGRMAEPEHIVLTLLKHFSLIPVLFNKKVLITAGPTQEDIDPVRYISNHSSGKMGYAIARAFANAGADVTLISGPSHEQIEDSTIHKIMVRSAQEMYEATNVLFEQSAIVILAAAVADYSPLHKATQKIKKKEPTFSIEMGKTIDIAATIGQRKTKQIIVGFALETNNEVANAKEKLKRKNFDFIVLNSLQDKNAGFGHDTNKISIIDRHENIKEYALKAKNDVAQDIIEAILERIES